MPTKLRNLLALIKESGCYTETTSKGHYLVLNKKGMTIASFGVAHGKRTKRDEVLDNYVREVRKALERQNE